MVLLAAVAVLVMRGIVIFEVGAIMERKTVAVVGPATRKRRSGLKSSDGTMTGLAIFNGAPEIR
jgi:hypothetical protein